MVFIIWNWKDAVTSKMGKQNQNRIKPKISRHTCLYFSTFTCLGVLLNHLALQKSNIKFFFFFFVVSVIIFHILCSGIIFWDRCTFSSVVLERPETSYSVQMHYLCECEGKLGRINWQNHCCSPFCREVRVHGTKRSTITF